MTEQRKIDPKNAKETSLFERADKAFGLENLSLQRCRAIFRKWKKRAQSGATGFAENG